ncbi:hypothetical protein FISHEDRAFT_66270 [Fistulina hepatica ATCC 64428]|uniref:Uncharacterized protein n=1 Tax=Fistulina hepatica ATCC 64428 TaxID=1128425 RepID=A0A0D7A790_9AGAR|nr:hypothetical protein FISHEDRAFT_66270 [Fistulina hepatica ATCC 64428]
MIGTSLHEYIFIRLCILCLLLVNPLSMVYLLGCCIRGRVLISPILVAFCAAEVAFFLFVYLPRKKRLQKPVSSPPDLSLERRHVLFSRCAKYITHAGAAAFPTGWFLSSSSASRLTRENVREWLLWAFFHATRQEYLPEWTEEIEHYIDAVEDILGRKLEEGNKEGTKPMRITLDPVTSVHRPLVWYALVALVDQCTAVRLLSRGFRHYSPRQWFKVFPPRPHTLASRASVVQNMSYWYFSGTSTNAKPPIVFIHGLGIGLYPYVPLLVELVARDRSRPVVVIELLPISMRITAPLPPRAVVVSSIATILDSLSIERFVLATHSYGTVVSAHILDSPLNARVTDCLMIDPIPFLLHLPDVAYNFWYRPPVRANEWQLWYFASRDPDISRCIGRSFFWADNILWREDVEAFVRDGERHFAVVLSEADQIVNSRAVHRYLTGEEHPSFHWTGFNGNLEVLFYKGLDHATVMDTKARRSPMLDILTRFGTS